MLRQPRFGVVGLNDNLKSWAMNLVGNEFAAHDPIAPRSNPANLLVTGEFKPIDGIEFDHFSGVADLGSRNETKPRRHRRAV